MGCGGCGKAKAEMIKRIQATKQANIKSPVIPPVKPVVTNPVKPLIPVTNIAPVTKTRRQLRIEARTKRIAERSERVRQRNLLAAQQAQLQNNQSNINE